MELSHHLTKKLCCAFNSYRACASPCREKASNFGNNREILTNLPQTWTKQRQSCFGLLFVTLF